jgi:Flp pilus assembly protein CpaB
MRRSNNPSSIEAGRAVTALKGSCALAAVLEEGKRAVTVRVDDALPTSSCPAISSMSS